MVLVGFLALRSSFLLARRELLADRSLFEAVEIEANVPEEVSL